ncbi:MAG TPA: hypothetical protein VMF08_12260 [Candidatus Sulfotelmatobacter sp.]|nr:hypothetical protein [Candidatus Sulfotelmatobacter sp.]
MRTPFQLNRRARVYLHCATGVLSLFVFLFMWTAEICPPLHEWLHGGAIPDDDDCAVVAIAIGHVHAGVCKVPPPVPVAVVEITLRAEITVFVPSEKVLPNGRAPPASLV